VRQVLEFSFLRFFHWNVFSLQILEAGLGIGSDLIFYFVYHLKALCQEFFVFSTTMAADEREDTLSKKKTVPWDTVRKLFDFLKNQQLMGAENSKRRSFQNLFKKGQKGH
jgi:hypothetical protein